MLCFSDRRATHGGEGSETAVVVVSRGGVDNSKMAKLDRIWHVLLLARLSWQSGSYERYEGYLEEIIERHVLLLRHHYRNTEA